MVPAVAIAGFFVSPIVTKLINACSVYLEDQGRWLTGMKKELQRLQKNLIRIQAVVDDSSEAQITANPALMAWRWQLRDVIDEADDLLDDFEYMKHKEQLIKRNMEETKKISDTTRFLFEGARKIGKRAFKIDRNLKRLKKVVRKLDEVLAEADTFLHIVDNTKKEQQKQELDLFNFRETGFVSKKDLVGRGKEVEFVMQWLRKPISEDPTHITPSTSYDNISLLSIVGHGGMGKTALLRHVYEDMKDDFDLKMWICVSTDFDPKKVIANMLKHREKDKDSSESLAAESLDVLQRNLMSMVQKKKFLLVLDDIWEEEEEGRDISKWEKVLDPLISGSLGGKILVTTRMDSVASMIAKVIRKKMIKLPLKGMKEDECLKLFERYAFAVEDNLEDHKNLRHMARDFVKKLSGSPLAAKVIGAALNHNLDETCWRSVLNSDIGSAALGPNNIMPILGLSYTFLPKHLKCCFAFCSIFPQAHEFDKDDLVRMWISLGFIQAPSPPGVTLEDIGRRYFDILVKKSFFDMQNDYGIRYYTIHDLLHELAQSISKHEVFRFTGIKEIPSIIPETTQHLFIDIDNLEKIRKLKNLHSLFLTGGGNKENIREVLTNFFKASRSIRLLSILSFSVKELPKAIKKLTHLRYLNIPFVKHLPRSLSRLYHLQFIIGISCRGNRAILPRDMNNLTNLLYLNIEPPEAFSSIPGIGKLKSLQELYGFYIKDENGFRIGELEHMNSLRLLRINDLHNLRDAEEARSAKLNDKIYLTNLFLNFSKTTILMESDWDEAPKILENLQPPRNLQKLSIISYTGVKSAIWMDNAESISNLKEIELKDCLFWETLPPFGQLPFLESLYLIKMPKVKRFNDKFCVFPSLERPCIRKLGAPEDESLFPCLTMLCLEDCPNLLEFPTLPPKLETLVIKRIGWKDLNWKQGISNFCSISKSIPLKKLLVIGCPNLTSLPLADETVRLEALQYLQIRDCPNLTSLGGLQDVGSSENFKLTLSHLTISDPSVLQMEPLRSITSIEKLDIMFNDELVSFPSEAQHWFLQDRSSLRELEIGPLKSLQSLPSYLESLSSLKILTITNVPLLELLPNIPASLETLKLDKLQSLQCQLSSLSTLHNSSLKYLELDGIPLLKSLPDLPPSLKDLKIVDCHPELKERYEMPSGSDLQKFAHFPDLRIRFEKY